MIKYFVEIWRINLILLLEMKIVANISFPFFIIRVIFYYPRIILPMND